MRSHLHREREDEGATLPPTPDDAVAAFVAAALADCTAADDVRLSDHHLEAHFVTPDDEERRMIEVARFAQRKAAALADAIARLPWPAVVSETAREAWRGAAAEQRAVVVPTGPSLHGVWLQARVLGGELRAASVSVRTRWTNDGPMTRVELDLTQAPLPAAAVAALEGDSPAPFRAAFASATASPDGRHATLEQSGLASDPRGLLPAVEAFFQWVLDARGERRADAPYR